MVDKNIALNQLDTIQRGYLKFILISPRDVKTHLFKISISLPDDPDLKEEKELLFDLYKFFDYIEHEKVR